MKAFLDFSNMENLNLMYADKYLSDDINRYICKESLKSGKLSAIPKQIISVKDKNYK